MHYRICHARSPLASEFSEIAHSTAFRSSVPRSCGSPYVENHSCASIVPLAPSIVSHAKAPFSESIVTQNPRGGIINAKPAPTTPLPLKSAANASRPRAIYEFNEEETGVLCTHSFRYTPLL